MRFGEKLRRVHIKRSRGREFVVEIPKLTEPDYTHKKYEEVAARVAGLDYTWGVYHSGDEFIKSLKNSEKIIAKTKKDAIAGAHILSALHILYGIYHGGLQKKNTELRNLQKRLVTL